MPKFKTVILFKESKDFRNGQITIQSVIQYSVSKWSLVTFKMLESQLFLLTTSFHYATAFMTNINFIFTKGALHIIRAIVILLYNFRALTLHVA